MPLGVASLPVLNALLNAVGALLLAGGHAFVRSRRIEAHMLGAFGVSVGYLTLRYFAQFRLKRRSRLLPLRTPDFAGHHSL